MFAVIGWANPDAPESHSKAATAHRGESRDRGPPRFSFDPNVKTLEAKVLRPAAIAHRSRKPSPGLGPLREDGRLRGLAQRVPLRLREHDAVGAPRARGLSPPRGSGGRTRPSPRPGTPPAPLPSLRSRGVASPRTQLATKPSRGARKCHCVNAQNRGKRSIFE